MIFAGRPSGAGMVLSSVSSLMGLFAMRSRAGPDSTPCEAQAYTSVAPPISTIALAALQREPAVSTISSNRMHFLPRTSPMTFMTSQQFAFSRRLSTMASPMPILLANVRLRATEPTSGETTTISS